LPIYSKYSSRIEAHQKFHKENNSGNPKDSRNTDYSCTRCYPAKENTVQFQNFVDWARENINLKSYSLITQRTFATLLNYSPLSDPFWDALYLLLVSCRYTEVTSFVHIRAAIQTALIETKRFTRTEKEDSDFHGFSEAFTNSYQLPEEYQTAPLYPPETSESSQAENTEEEAEVTITKQVLTEEEQKLAEEIADLAKYFEQSQSEKEFLSPEPVATSSRKGKEPVQEVPVLPKPPKVTKTPEPTNNPLPNPNLMDANAVADLIA